MSYNNWRLHKNEIVQIAYALKQLETRTYPREVYGEKTLNRDELKSLADRFFNAATNFGKKEPDESDKE